MSAAAADPSGRPSPQDTAEPTLVVPATALVPGHTIPPGTRIHDYRIDRVLGEGGFGIVYLATDIVLERQVAIKEYLPSSMAARAGQSLTVLVKSPVHEETFLMGLRSFVNEAKLLARFDHPALLKVHQFWEANGTAYMAMPYYQGPTLKASLAKLGRLPTEHEVRAWLMPLLDALEVIHNEHIYHRDIAPDNILLTAHGPLLLDFGAARRVIGDLTHALTAMLKPGFAPIEQYGDMPGVTQGPWTDIFALASVLYAAISGGRTVASVERLLNDQMPRLSTVAAGRCGNAFLAAIDKALAIHPKDRPQSIAEFRALLMADDTQAIDLLELERLGGPPAGDATVLVPDFAPTQVGPGSSPAVPHERTLQVPPPVTVPPPALPAPVSMPMPPAPAAEPVQATTPAAPRRGLVLSLAGAAGLAALAWGGYRLTTAPAPGVLPPSPVASAAEATTAPSPQLTPTAAPASAPDAPASIATSVPVAEPPPPAPTTAAPVTPKPRATVPAPAPAATRGANCSDILQKASLEPLTPAEAAYLKKECR